MKFLTHDILPSVNLYCFYLTENRSEYTLDNIIADTVCLFGCRTELRTAAVSVIKTFREKYETLKRFLLEVRYCVANIGLNNQMFRSKLKRFIKVTSSL